MFKGPPVELICPKDLTFPYVTSPAICSCRALAWKWLAHKRDISARVDRTLDSSSWKTPSTPSSNYTAPKSQTYRPSKLLWSRVRKISVSSSRTKGAAFHIALYHSSGHICMRQWRIKTLIKTSRVRTSRRLSQVSATGCHSRDW